MKDLVLKWWQVAIYEISVFSLGLVMGARWFYFFRPYLLFFLVIFIFSGSYILFVWLRQQKP